MDSACKGCRGDFRVTQEQIDRMLAAPMFQGDRTVPDSVYKARLQQCGSCPRLLDGHTCSLCGCIVQVTAKLREKSCPQPGGMGWGRE